MEFVKYKTFHHVDQANQLLNLLKENQIKYKVVEFMPNLDASFRGSSPIEKEIVVKIQQKDFKTINQIWENKLHVNLQDLDENHYIFQFTDEELFDILTRPDEWSPVDYKLSIELLKKRGKNIDEDLIKSLTKQRFTDLAKEESSQVPWIIVGYFASVLGGLIGIGIGWHLKSSKKVLLNGDVVYSYSEKDRGHGKSIFYMGVIVLSIWVLYWMYSNVFQI